MSELKFNVSYAASDQLSSLPQRAMIRFLFKFVLCVLLALAAGFAYLAVRSGDPVYTCYEWMRPARFQQYERPIRSIAMQYYLDSMPVQAEVWRASRSDP